jgi:polyketide biosynthesis 3-hydroxy-3-methylglutaryl-CoA synthase-like enzyme PksG
MRIGEHLAARRELSFAEYTALLADTRRCLVPRPSAQIELDPYVDLVKAGGSGRPVLALTEIKDYARHYEWI